LIDGEGLDAAGDTMRGPSHGDDQDLASGWRLPRRTVPSLKRVGRRHTLILGKGESLGEKSEGEDCGEGAGDWVGHGSFLRRWNKEKRWVAAIVRVWDSFLSVTRQRRRF
jgi:hypothetical protein